jgi:hypothetical protein
MASIVVNGDTSGAVTLSAPAVAGTVTVTLPTTTGTMLTTASSTGISGSAISSGTVAEAYGGTGTNTGYYGFKNRIINGAMVIDQRNAAASVSGTTGVYTLDRWTVQNNSGSARFNVQQNVNSVTPPAGYKYYLGITSTSAYSVAATDILGIQQFIEGYNTADFAWGTASATAITLSFWVRSSLTGTFGGSVVEGAAGSALYPFTYTISTANTWEQKTVTIAGPTIGTWNSTNGRSIQLLFSMGTGSSFTGTAGSWTTSSYYAPTGATSVVGTNGATFYITGVQLEKGSTATSFDYRPYGTEYVLCQRYYQNLGNVGCVAYATQGVTLPVIWPVEFRATPSVSISYSGTANRLYRFQTGGTADITPTIFATNKTITNLYYLSGTWAVGLGEGWTTAIVGSAEL